MYMDEFDAFYNYELAENVVKVLKEKYPECQMVLTPLFKATGRELREGHNLEKMYIGGEFSKYE